MKIKPVFNNIIINAFFLPLMLSLTALLAAPGWRVILGGQRIDAGQAPAHLSHVRFRELVGHQMSH